MRFPPLPFTPLQTPLAAIEALDLAAATDIVASEDDPGARHEDWHPDFPREDDRDGVGMMQELTGWESRQVRRLADGLVVGSIGFFGPPEPADDGVLETEVGFGLVAEARGKGLMGQVLPALLSLSDAVGVRIRAGTLRDNAASLALLRRAGFVDRATPDDDPDREVVLVREVPGS